jgi:4-hydroxybenzoate polyprenyltransferase
MAVAGSTRPLDRAAAAGVASWRSPVRAAVAALRPEQWSKNLLLFAGIVFAAKIGDGTRWVEAWTAFAVYCAASSAAYLVNDVRDASHDRAHPVKCRRPIARGDLRPRAALTLAGVLLAVAVAGATALGPWSLLVLASFASVQAAYTLWLKHLVLIDVMTISALFVVRAVAGAVAVDVRISPWLLICTALLALFLGLAKRRGELVLVTAQQTQGRPVLTGYSLPLIDQLIAIVASSTLIAYSLYTFTAHDSQAMMITIPFVLFGIFRYVLLVNRDDLGEEPEKILLSDGPLIIAVAAWAVTAAAILITV